MPLFLFLWWNYDCGRKRGWEEIFHLWANHWICGWVEWWFGHIYALEGGPKRVWVNVGGVLWKEKGASDQDFACNLEVVTIQPWLVHCGQGSTILALPSSSLLYTIIHHFSSPATRIEEVHYWRECPLGMDINVLQTLYFVFCHYCISMYSQFWCIHDILGLLLCQGDSSLAFL